MIFEREKIQIMKLKTAIYFSNFNKSDIYRLIYSNNYNFSRNHLNFKINFSTVTYSEVQSSMMTHHVDSAVMQAVTSS